MSFTSLQHYLTGGLSKMECEHAFVYSHQEKERILYDDVNFDLVDVCVCTKCGKVARQAKYQEKSEN